MEEFLSIFKKALATIREPRLFKTERGYQGALVAELQRRLNQAAFPGDPIIEQEYQKTFPHHGITIRPDLIVHIPFERNGTARRQDGNFVAIEIKVRATALEASQDFVSLNAMKEKLNYPITIFLNLDSSEAHAERCPPKIAAQTVCFAVRLRDQKPVVLMTRCS
jgi:hypothetical protein